MKLSHEMSLFERIFAPLRRPHVVLGWWGSIESEGATAGDALAIDALASWLVANGCLVSVASLAPYAHPNVRTVDWRRGPALKADVFAFVCGPIVPDALLRQLLDRFRHCRRLAVGVSVLDPRDPELAQLFDVIVARDGRVPETFDLALASGRSWAAKRSRVRAGRIGLCLRGPQGEYGAEICRHDLAARSAEEAIRRLGAEPVEIDTVMRKPGCGVSEVLERFDSLDLVITTRLHGSLFALAQRIPFVAIDQIEGGRKVSRLLTRIGWPFVFDARRATPERICEAATVAAAPAFDATLESCRLRAMVLSREALEAAGQAIVVAARR